MKKVDHSDSFNKLSTSYMLGTLLNFILDGQWSEFYAHQNHTHTHLFIPFEKYTKN